MYIPTSAPYLGKTETKNVLKVMKQGAISGLSGRYVQEFERQFARFSGCRYGIAVNSGTTALHLAIAALGIAKGDEVLVSSLTNMATFFAVLYQGARAVPIDIEPDTLNIDPRLIEKKINPRTKAIMVVHLFGHPVDMGPILTLAKKYKLYVIEDCAEAHGALYKNKKVGSLGDVGCFSFYANKIVTTGEGGMLTTDNKKLAEKIYNLKGLAFGEQNKFMHKDIGFGYRMSNLQAAIGCAQIKKINAVIEKKRKIARFYNTHFGDIPELQLPVEKSYAKNVYWMYHLVLNRKAGISREKLMQQLKKYGIETRESFVPYNMQEVFIKKGWTRKEDCPVANNIAANGFYIPSGYALKQSELRYVVSKIRNIFGKKAEG